mmetsp:Transcript_26421/g.62762  ORF Transcript_26421/g.62762 Transcript_26421/m.62762 type:complete len:363 (-) Transcript_26421:17-1105(-)
MVVYRHRRGLHGQAAAQAARLRWRGRLWTALVRDAVPLLPDSFHPRDGGAHNILCRRVVLAGDDPSHADHRLRPAAPDRRRGPEAMEGRGRRAALDAPIHPLLSRPPGGAVFGRVWQRRRPARRGGASAGAVGWSLLTPVVLPAGRAGRWSTAAVGCGDARAGLSRVGMTGQLLSSSERQLAMHRAVLEWGRRGETPQKVLNKRTGAMKLDSPGWKAPCVGGIFKRCCEYTQEPCIAMERMGHTLPVLPPYLCSALKGPYWFGQQTVERPPIRLRKHSWVIMGAHNTHLQKLCLFAFGMWFVARSVRELGRSEQSQVGIMVWAPPFQGPIQLCHYKMNQKCSGKETCSGPKMIWCYVMEAGN